MRSTLGTTTTPVSAAAVEEMHAASWKSPREEVMGPAPYRSRGAFDDDLAPARGIGIAMIAGAVAWVGLAWMALTVFARFA